MTGGRDDGWTALNGEKINDNIPEAREDERPITPRDIPRERPADVLKALRKAENAKVDDVTIFPLRIVAVVLSVVSKRIFRTLNIVAVVNLSSVAVLTWYLRMEKMILGYLIILLVNLTQSNLLVMLTSFMYLLMLL